MNSEKIAADLINALKKNVKENATKDTARLQDLRDTLASGQQYRLQKRAKQKISAKILAGGETARGPVCDNYFYFFKDATVVRLHEPDKKPNCEVRVQREIPTDIEIDSSTIDGMKEGFYVLDDGTVVIRMPEDGSAIEFFIEDGAGAIADDGLNYGCK